MATNNIQQNTFIPAIGTLPAGWGCTRVHNLFTEIVDRYDSKKDPSLPLLSVSEYYGVAERAEKIDEGEILVRASSLDGYKKCHAGDLVSNIMLTWRSALGVSPKDGIVSPAYCVYRPVSDVCGKYYHYLFRTQRYADIFKIHSTGLIDSRLRLYSAKFFAIKVPFPPLNEQKKIAKFLDEQCNKIDSICKEVQSSIYEYKSWKSSIIHEAVTKGLNPNVEMKDSGVNWIGQTPKTWKIQRAKHHVVITHGSDPKTEGVIPVYGSGAESFKTCGEYKTGPAVLLGRKGATLHIPHYIKGRYWNIDTAFDVKTGEKLDLKYYYYLAFCFDYKFYISQTTLPGMTQTSYNNMLIPIPPIQEQKKIVAFVDAKCNLVDNLISEKQALISDLESYKKALIYEVVTGKRKVV